MRIYLQLTPNTEIVPFNYQQSLVGTLHKWLGENNLHDDISLYSLSWLSSGVKTKKGLNFPQGCEFFISSPLPDLHQKTVQGIFNGQDIRWGMKVVEVRMKIPPLFGDQQRFVPQSPILIQRTIDSQKHKKYYFYSDPEANALMTETLNSKLSHAGIPDRVTVSFDPDYRNPYIKMIKYRNLNIKASMCPVIVEGEPRAVQFAWEVGVGNSTGIGFGALR